MVLKTNYYYGRAFTILTAVAAAVLAAFLVVSASAPKPAQAAFPGPNGPIAYTEKVGSFDQIFTVSPDGKRKQITTDANSHREPRFSPDGNTLVYFDSLYDLHTVPVSGGTPSAALDQNASGASFSPHGDKIIYTKIDSNFKEQIFTIPTTGGTPTQITSDNVDHAQPRFDPVDETKIAFSAYDPDTNQKQIFTMSLSGGTPTKLTNSISSADNPADGNILDDWSCSGTKLLYEAFQKVNGKQVRQLYVIPTAGGTATQVTKGTKDHYKGAFSPDTKRIAYESPNSKGIYQINTIPSSGGKAKVVAKSTTPHFDPNWGVNNSAP